MKEGWREVALGEVATIERSGIAPEQIADGTTYVGLENITSDGYFTGFGTVAAGELASQKFRFSSDHVLYGKLRPYLAKIAAPTFDGVCSTDILPIRTRPNLDHRYLLHFLRQPSEVAKAASLATGANLPRLSPRVLAEIQIPLPPLDEQRRIAAVLDKADELRAKRRAALDILDTLTESIFLDMFGDPVTNPKGWPTCELGSLGSLERGISKHRPRNDARLLGGPYPLIQTGDVANSGGYIANHFATYSELGLRQSKLWSAGTLCITIAANIARTGILAFDACFPDSVVGFTPGHSVSNEFVRAIMSFHQTRLEMGASESAQKNINLQVLRSLHVPVPPRDSIYIFDLAVQRAKGITDSQHAHLAHLDQLFLSLQQRAFRGEL